MTPTKKLEIVIDATHTPELLAALKRAGAPGYTVIRNVEGTGDRGERAGDELTDVFRNCYIVVACPAERVEPLTDAVRPLLERHGGMCLCSDATWLEH